MERKPSRIDLTPTQVRVLRLIAERPSRVKELIAPGLSEATIHRATAVLRELGFIISADGIQTVTPAGIRWLESLRTTSSARPSLPIPALDLLPTVEHRSFVELGLCAAVARTHLGLLEGLPGLVLVGDSGAQKTRASRALVAAAGGDPHGDVVEASLPSGRGVFVRHNARGEEISRSRLLEVPVAVFDECDKCGDDVTQLMIEQAYFHGTARVRLERTFVDMRATPVAVMNPRAPIAEGFARRTAFHSSLFRRVAYCEWEGLAVPRPNDGTDWLAEFLRVDAARRVKLPPPRAPGLNAAGAIRRAFDQIVAKKSVAKTLDEFMFANFARGATAWLDDESAIQLVVWNWAIGAARTGILVPEWSLALRMHFAPRETEAELKRAERADLLNQLDKALVAAFDGDLIRAVQFAEVLVELKKVGIDLRSDSTVTQLKDVLTLVTTKLRGNWKLAKRLLGLRSVLRENGMTTRTVVGLATVVGTKQIPATAAAYLLAVGYGSYFRDHARLMGVPDPKLKPPEKPPANPGQPVLPPGYPRAPR